MTWRAGSRPEPGLLGEAGEGNRALVVWWEAGC